MDLIISGILNGVVEIVTNFWYLIILIIIAIILSSPKVKGYFGEREVIRNLDKLDSTKYKVINNIMIKSSNKTSQIDHVVVSDYGIFVIETKNYKGWIVGNEYDDYWKQVIYKRKEKLRNPIKQNYGHIQALKQNLDGVDSKVFISIVTFTTKTDLKVKTSSEVVYTMNLKKTIEKYKTKVLSNEDKDIIYNKLLNLNIDTKENRKIHVNNIREDIRNNDGKIKNDVCPKCGGILVLRKGKYGEFNGCSNYPRCRFTVK